MNYINDLNLPQPFVDAVTRDYEYKDKRYSVTATLGGTCEAVLKHRHGSEIVVDVAASVWAIFGSAVHQILQNAKETDEQLKENWLAVDMGDGYTLSGIFDLYDDSTGTVTDYKTASVWKAIYGETEDWRLQTLAYCWMLRKTGFDAHRGEIVALIKDFSKRDAATKDGYPRHPVVKYEWDFAEEDFEAIEDRLYKWFGAVRLQESREDAMLKPCNPEQRWHKNDKWAVMEKGKKRALRVLDSQEEAIEWANGRGIDLDDGKHSIDFRRGEDTKCEGYCDVRKWCPLYQSKVNEEF